MQELKKLVGKKRKKEWCEGSDLDEACVLVTVLVSLLGLVNGCMLCLCVQVLFFAHTALFTGSIIVLCSSHRFCKCSLKLLGLLVWIVPVS